MKLVSCSILPIATFYDLSNEAFRIVSIALGASIRNPYGIMELNGNNMLLEYASLRFSMDNDVDDCTANNEYHGQLVGIILSAENTTTKLEKILALYIYMAISIKNSNHTVKVCDAKILSVATSLVRMENEDLPKMLLLSDDTLFKWSMNVIARFKSLKNLYSDLVLCIDGLIDVL